MEWKEQILELPMDDPKARPLTLYVKVVDLHGELGVAAVKVDAAVGRVDQRLEGPRAGELYVSFSYTVLPWRETN